MWWEDVKTGWILKDSYNDLWVITKLSTRMDDAAHEFLILRMHCLTKEADGSEVWTQRERKLEETK